jgi:hypothetical protein
MGEQTFILPALIHVGFVVEKIMGGGAESFSPTVHLHFP